MWAVSIMASLESNVTESNANNISPMATSAMDSYSGTIPSQICIHPLVLLNLSDQATRRRCISSMDNSQIPQNQSHCQTSLGVLLGTKTDEDKQTAFVNSFEILYEVKSSDLNSGRNSSSSNQIHTDSDSSDKKCALDIDEQFLSSRRDQYRTIFPHLEILGFYIAAPGCASEDYQRQAARDIVASAFSHCGQLKLSLVDHSPYYVLYFDVDRAELKAVSSPSFPIRVFDCKKDFRTVSYCVESEESERIGIQHVARTRSSGSAGGQFADHLTTFMNSLSMLNSRVDLIIDYVEAVKDGTNSNAGGLNLMADSTNEISESDDENSSNMHQILALVHNLCVQLQSIQPASFHTDLKRSLREAMMTVDLSHITHAIAQLTGSLEGVQIAKKSVVSDFVDRKDRRHMGGLRTRY